MPINSQRQLIRELMPDLRRLRAKGYSFQQLASMLNQGGLTLQPATVRSYYLEILYAQMEQHEIVLMHMVEIETMLQVLIDQDQACQ